ncbi:MAG: hypothetical protein JHC22_08025 [Thermoproteus sp.]|nr:hypothetical protein [Thermoproteus sp.]
MKFRTLALLLLTAAVLQAVPPSAAVYCGNGSVYYVVYNGTSRVKYVLGVNATYLPPQVLPQYVLMYPYALLAASAVVALVATVGFGRLGRRGALVATMTGVALSVPSWIGVAAPYAPVQVCQDVTYVAPLPQVMFLGAGLLAAAAIALSAVSLATEEAL